MTTQNIQPENSDSDVTVAEHSPASENPANSTSEEVAASSINQIPSETQETGSELQETHNQVGALAGTVGEENQTPLNTSPADQIATENTHDEQPIAQEEVRPFTDFIEEFRQAEIRQGGAQLDQPTQYEESTPIELAAHFPISTEDTPLVAEGVEIQTFTPSQEENVGAGEDVAKGQGPLGRPGEPSPTEPSIEQIAATEENVGAQFIAPAEPVAKPERPVSPLLRPATRIRLPRHGGRQREERTTTGTTAVPTGSTSEAAQSSGGTQSTAEPIPAQEQPKPARRYRFDRPAQTTTPPSVPSFPSTSATSTEESKEIINRVPTTSTSAQRENGQVAEHEELEAQQAEQQPKQTTVHEPSAVHAEETATKTAAPVTSIHERKRRHGQERQHEKEQAASSTSSMPSTSPVAPEGEETSHSKEVAAQEATEVPLEDLPPLEYSELQAASSRRRRKRRANSTPTSPAAATPATNTTSVAKSTAAEQPVSPATPQPTPVAVPKNVVASASPYNIVSGYTVNQMNQGNDINGPFMGPEPSPARGSTISREVRPIRNEVQRTSSYPTRSNEASYSPASVNHLANVVAQAIQSQTDRMVAELRRANQIPTSVSVSLPPFPSTERVGVFVDVANLLYSARTLRMTVDFGKLLDFLRGNRRLVRAHAYCPTSSQPGDEQMFLQAVKGLGYRITTKNYKTFSSGAKKADLDLDLCMDVVRLVDGKAVDCIVLVSGDSDFMPMLDYCSDHGVRVEVAAFDEAMSATLRQSCDLFINLSMLEEIRA